MLGKLSGDTLALFKKTGSTYTKQGFKKLAALKLLFVDESMLALSLKMFDFFKGCAQGDLSPVAYKAKVWDSFKYFSKAGVPLPTIVQVICMCLGLNKKYGSLLTKFEERTHLYSDMTLKSITDWCKH